MVYSLIHVTFSHVRRLLSSLWRFGQETKWKATLKKWRISPSSIFDGKLNIKNKNPPCVSAFSTFRPADGIRAQIPSLAWTRVGPAVYKSIKLLISKDRILFLMSAVIIRPVLWHFVSLKCSFYDFTGCCWFNILSDKTQASTKTRFKHDNNYFNKFGNAWNIFIN